MDIANFIVLCYNITMQLSRADKLINFMKASLSMEGLKPSQKVVEDCLLLLLGKLSPVDRAAAITKLNARAAKVGEKERKAALSDLLFFRAIMAAESYDGGESALITGLHQSLYEGLYGGAGELRKTPLEFLGNQFTDAKYIQHSLNVLVKKMEGVKRSPEISKGEFTKLFTYYYQQLYLLAPFPYGNGLTIRLYLYFYAAERGFGFMIKYPTALKAGEEAAFTGDNIVPLYEALCDNLIYMTRVMLSPRTPVKKAADKTGPSVGETKNASASPKKPAAKKLREEKVANPNKKIPTKRTPGGIISDSPDRLPSILPENHGSGPAGSVTDGDFNYDKPAIDEAAATLNYTAQEPNASTETRAQKVSQVKKSDAKESFSHNSPPPTENHDDAVFRNDSNTQSGDKSEPIKKSKENGEQTEAVQEENMVIYDYEIITSSLPPEKEFNLENAPYALLKKAYRLQERIEKFSRKLDSLLKSFKK